MKTLIVLVILISLSACAERSSYSVQDFLGVYENNAGEKLNLMENSQYFVINGGSVKQFGAWEILKQQRVRLHICKDRPKTLDINYKCKEFTNAYAVPSTKTSNGKIILSFGEKAESNYSKLKK